MDIMEYHSSLMGFRQGRRRHLAHINSEAKGLSGRRRGGFAAFFSDRK